MLTLLTQEAKAHEVSLNSVIQIAYLHAYWKTIQKKTSVELSSAMNLRNKCTPRVPKDVCGNYFCAFGFVLDKQTLEEDFWAMAKKYHAHLTRVIQQANFLPTVYEDLPMQQTVESLMKPPTDLLEDRLGSSSMGQICFKTKKLTIIDCLVRPKNADRPNLLSYQWNDDLACVFCFPKKFRTKDWMRTLIHHFDAQLRTLPTKLSTS